MNMDKDAISELFSVFGPVDMRPMFGCAGLYADGVFFALVDDGVIYLKADDGTALRFAAEGCKRFTYRTRAREVATNLWRMPERLYDDPDELADWARQAHAVAVRAQTKKPRRKSTAASKNTQKPKAPVRRPARSARSGIRGRSRK